MTVKTGAAWAGTFVCRDGTGALSTPSVGPAGTLYVDGVANAASVTISGSNPYKFSLTLPALTAGQRVDMYITATIATIATAAVVASDQADTKLISDDLGYLKPTTAGRTLDVTANGEAGIDWANIGNPTSTVALSDTTVNLGATQGAITWGQQKIVANAANEGALDIRNANANGIGTYNQGGDVGLYNDGTALYGQYNVGADTGLYNNGTGAGAYGNYNAGDAIGQYNAASGAASIGQTNQGVADGQYNNGTGAAGIGSKNEGTVYGMQATGGTADTDPAIVTTATVFPTGAIEFTYTVTDSSTGLPLEGVEVWISTDNPAVNIVWKGDTDAFGVAMDVLGNKPKLDPGTYYFWRQLAGYTFTDPDSEAVS